MNSNLKFTFGILAYLYYMATMAMNCWYVIKSGKCIAIVSSTIVFFDHDKDGWQPKRAKIMKNVDNFLFWKLCNHISSDAKLSWHQEYTSHMIFLPCRVRKE
jgi:hypothetical protein